MPLSQPAKIPGFTVSPIMPEYPAPGDIWIERNYLDGIMDEWFFDGSRWRSMQTFQLQWALNPSTSASNMLIPLQQISLDNYNIYLLSMFTCLFVVAPNNLTSYWTASFSRVSSTNAITTMTSVNTSGKAASAWIKTNEPINTLLDIAGGMNAWLFRFDTLKTGGAGTLYGGVTVTYQLVRP